MARAHLHALMIAVAAMVTISPMASSAEPLSRDKERALKPKDTFKECAACPEMVVVPPGSFMMGPAEYEPGTYEFGQGERPQQHKVTIANPFAVSKFEVTFKQWDACIEQGGCKAHPSDEGWGRGNRPVIHVNWNDARQYVVWLSKVTRKAYRLLSDAEWEYAARGGTTTRFYWGDSIGKGNANCRSCGSQWDNKQTAPVGSFAPNAFGLYDMHGNVSEWVQDCDAGNRAAPADGSARTNARCAKRIVRGGSYIDRPRDLLYYGPTGGENIRERNYYLGFRVGRALSVQWVR